MRPKSPTNNIVRRTGSTDGELSKRSQFFDLFKQSPIPDDEMLGTLGLVEQVAAMLSPDIRQRIRLISLRDAVALTRYGEQVFGYESTNVQDPLS